MFSARRHGLSNKDLEPISMKASMLLRSAYTGVLYYSGMLHARRYPKGMPSVIVGYHRVIPAGSEELGVIQPGMYVTTKTFEHHMEYIKRHYNVIAAEDLIENGEVRNACIVTFDDGWYDNYEYAFPILKKHRIPGTIFLATNLIGTDRRTWPDRIAFYINTAANDKVKDAIEIVHSQIRERPFSHLKGFFSSADRMVLADELVECLKMVPGETRDTLVNEIDSCMEDMNAGLREKRQWLTWDEIREMASCGITFGAHSHNHVILTRTNIENATREIEDSRDMLANELGKPAVTFSYPNGDYNREVMGIIHDLGFKQAVTTEPGLLDESESPLALKRIMIHNDMTRNRHMFVYRITKMVSRTRIHERDES
jgi:peptidoglycan/xylan/chitin deacetylase (PgdA/CDA1 family)